MSKEHHITVSLPDRSYPIIIGEGFIAGLTWQAPFAGPRPARVLILTNETVHTHWRGAAEAIAEVYDKEPVLCFVPDSEKSKSIKQAASIVSLMAEKDFDRSSLVIAFGGGVIGDLAGFVSSIFMRGIRYINIPTTLLAMVDSSIGGKTAVNLQDVKNCVGTFWQPSAVGADVRFLKTLPADFFRDGLAEVIKYGVIQDPGIVEILEGVDSLQDMTKDMLVRLIARCAAIKASVVEKDERETQGLRAVLNYGHTVGHALESFGSYQAISHGRAVAVGMICAGRLGMVLGLFSDSERMRMERLQERFGLGLLRYPDEAVETIIRTMEKDKKRKGKALRMVLPEKIGTVRVVEDINRDMLRTVLKETLCE